MFANFNIERLDRLLCDFYLLTGFTVSVWDAEYRQLGSQPKNISDFCRLIKSTPEGRRRCFESDCRLCRECAESGAPVTHHCHAGLIDMSIPLLFKETVIGYIMLGQAVDGTRPVHIEALADELSLDVGQLQEAYVAQSVYDAEKMNAAANLVKMATHDLWLSNYMEVGYDTLAVQIDRYIRTHLKEDITVATLCRQFAVSKNKLYDIAHTWFKMPVSAYVVALRVEYAKRLLVTTDIPVSEVAESVGIRDSNYFTKYFKAATGLTPLKFRQTMPMGCY